MKIWDYINEKRWRQETKWAVFVFIRTVIWFVIPLAVCLVTGQFAGNTDVNWGEYTFIVTGYVGITIGFLRSVLWLYRI